VDFAPNDGVAFANLFGDLVNEKNFFIVLGLLACTYGKKLAQLVNTPVTNILTVMIRSALHTLMVTVNSEKSIRNIIFAFDEK
jgi:hypothetical protein